MFRIQESNGPIGPEVGRGFPWHEAWEYRPRCQYVKTLKKDLRKGTKNKGIPWQVMDKLRADEWPLPVFFRYRSFRWLLVECIDQRCFIVVLLGEGVFCCMYRCTVDISESFLFQTMWDQSGDTLEIGGQCPNNFWDTYVQLCISRLVLESISEVFCLDKSLMRPKIADCYEPTNLSSMCTLGFFKTCFQPWKSWIINLEACTNMFPP